MKRKNQIAFLASHLNEICSYSLRIANLDNKNDVSVSTRGSTTDADELVGEADGEGDVKMVRTSVLTDSSNFTPLFPWELELRAIDLRLVKMNIR